MQYLLAIAAFTGQIAISQVDSSVTGSVVVARVVKERVLQSKIPGVTVELHSGRRLVQATVTDDSGGFQLRQVPDGIYSLRFSMIGFLDVEISPIKPGDNGLIVHLMPRPTPNEKAENPEPLSEPPPLKVRVELVQSPPDGIARARVVFTNEGPTEVLLPQELLERDAGSDELLMSVELRSSKAGELDSFVSSNWFSCSTLGNDCQNLAPGQSWWLDLVLYRQIPWSNGLREPMLIRELGDLRGSIHLDFLLPDAGPADHKRTRAIHDTFEFQVGDSKESLPQWEPLSPCW